MEKTVVGDCTFYLGDAREILPTLGYCADCIVSDPPYKLTQGGNKSCNLGGILSKEQYDNKGNLFAEDGEDLITWKEVMELYYNALRVGHCYVFSNDKNLREMLQEGHDIGFRFHNMLVLDKVSPTPNRWYMKNLEFIGMFFKGPAKHINNMGDKQLETFSRFKETEHPTEKPVKLMEKYILNSTQPREIVLDPFFGSGSTAIACMNTGRKFIGIEKNRRWYDLAIARAKTATLVSYNTLESCDQL